MTLIIYIVTMKCDGGIYMRKVSAIILIVLLVVTLGISGYSRAKTQCWEKEYQEVYVCYGDTLWSIAKSHNPKDIDIRKVIYDIQKINKLDKANIYEGQVLKVRTK